MAYENVLQINNRGDFRAWLSDHHNTERECYIVCKRGKPTDAEILYYIDAVEEALCFGWIDSTIRKVDGVNMQRFSPRSKKSNWTELNKERCRRLERLGLMTDAGRAVMPKLNEKFRIDAEIEAEFKKARVWTKFKSFHPLYQRVRASNLAFYMKHHPEAYERMLAHTIEETAKKKTFGEWNDYRRLIEQ